MGRIVPLGFRLSKSTYGSSWSVTTRVTRILCGRLSCLRQVLPKEDNPDFADDESDIARHPPEDAVSMAKGGSLALKRRFFTPSEGPWTSDG